MTRDRPSFLITIDTEGDNLWSKPEVITTRNSRYLPRFQELCERYGMRPTYLVNWEMANCPDFQQFAGDVLARNAGEIGMHLHAWNTPPHVTLTGSDHLHQPYLIEYPTDQIAAKIETLTAKLRGTFRAPVTSHRAGRWGFNATYARLLVEQGYRVDCSVTPGVSWSADRGDPRRAGGPDYSGYPTDAYQLDLDDIRLPGSSPLLELPVTTFARGYPRALERVRYGLRHRAFGSRVVNRLFPTALWVRPDGRNGRSLPGLLDRTRAEGRDYAQFMLHSSEFMPGGSPRFRTRRSVEALYRDIERLFRAAADQFTGRTLSEYHDHWTTRDFGK